MPEICQSTMPAEHELPAKHSRKDNTTLTLTLARALCVIIQKATKVFEHGIIGSVCLGSKHQVKPI